MPNPLDKVIELIKQTGDNCIMLDDQGYPAYVVMSFDKYQNMAVSGNNFAKNSQKDVVDQVNEEIASLHNDSEAHSTVESSDFQPVREILTPISGENSLDSAKNDIAGEKDGEKYYFEPID